MNTTTLKSQHAGAWMAAFRHELDRCLPAVLTAGWSYRLDARICMVYVLDPEGRGRAAAALPEGHSVSVPADVARHMCRICSQLAGEAGMPPVPKK